MAHKFDETIYRIALEHGLVPCNRLERAQEEASRTGSTLMSALVRNKDVAEADIMKLAAKTLNMEYVSLKNIKIDKHITEAIPYKFVTHYKFAPIKLENKILTIAVMAPLDIKTQDELRVHFGYDVHAVLASEKDVIDTLVRAYGLGADTIDKILEQPSLEDQVEAEDKGMRDQVEDIEKLAEDASVIKLVNQIILEACKKRATDIHIEPYRNEVKLRYRIDGVLYDANASPQIKKFLMPILSRIKIMSNLNIVERRLPQDGRAIVKAQDQVADLRVSFIPTPYGESVVIRILPAAMVFSLEKIGLGVSERKILEGLIAKPHGIIFVTGPTGSGKTTTLYACLNRINKKETKIITIEDPIEYEMTGVVQIQVMPEIGLTFARGLRAMLRHDPDVMMVGEVRDLETAEIAIRVALTGHLIFSTLHTNNAASGISRLIDIGVEPYLVSSSIEAFIAQRLVRVICPSCRKEDTRPRAELRSQIARELGFNSDEGQVKIYKGEGCEECNFTGFYGRTAIFEILVMNEELRDAVLRKPSADAIRRIAVNLGMKTLRQNGWQKVVEGVTTPEEIINVTQEEKREEIKSSFFEEKIETSAPAKTQKKEQEDIKNDKRVFIRLDATVPVHWKACPLDKMEDKRSITEFLTMTKNISAGGLLFLTKEPMSIGMILELKIEAPQESPIVCLARVLRIEEIEMEKVYRVAVCFLDLSGSDRSRLNRLVANESAGK